MSYSRVLNYTLFFVGMVLYDFGTVVILAVRVSI